MSESPMALQLRYLETLRDISSEQSSTILFPIPIDIFDAFLGTLSERDRDIFVRRYWYMDSIKKIADRHNCGESRIKSILARSRKKLYYLLTEAGYAE